MGLPHLARSASSALGRITWPMKVAPKLPCPPLSLRVRRRLHRKCPKWRRPRHEMRDQWKNGWELPRMILMDTSGSRKVNNNITGVKRWHCLKRSMYHEWQVVEYWVVLGCYDLSFLVWDSHTGPLGLVLVTFCFVLSPLFGSAWQRFLTKCSEISCYPRSQAVHQHCNPSSLFQMQHSCLVFGMG